MKSVTERIAQYIYHVVNQIKYNSGKQVNCLCFHTLSNFIAMPLARQICHILANFLIVELLKS